LRGATITLSSTFSHGSRQGDWKTIARSGPGAVTSVPSMITPP
jgi:hypothetical protein